MIISIAFLIALIASPIMWLMYKAIKSGEFEGGSVDRIRLIKELEMIESINEQNKSKNT